jgi:hypothetical protein
LLLSIRVRSPVKHLPDEATLARDHHTSGVYYRFLV